MQSGESHSADQLVSFKSTSSSSFQSMFGVHPLDASSQNGSLDQRLDLNNTSFERGRKMHSIHSIQGVHGVRALLLGSWGQPSTMLQFHG